MVREAATVAYGTASGSSGTPHDKPPDSRDDVPMETATRTFSFVLTVDVEPHHPGYDDPEWIADAAWGALTNLYGLRAIYSDITDKPAHDTGG